VNRVLVKEEDQNEPTIGEKLASLDLIQNDKSKSDDSKIDDSKRGEKQLESSSQLIQPPTADSVQLLLRQALRADDRALLLDCLYNRDEKVSFSF
jgi:U3 small nucleolar RNA-associated protein 5